MEEIKERLAGDFSFESIILLIFVTQLRSKPLNLSEKSRKSVSRRG